MKLFLDTAIVSDIEERIDTGLIHGITTNPTLIRKSGRDPWKVYSDIIELGVEDLSIELNGDSSKEFIANACLLYTSPSPRDLSTSRMPSSA